MLHWREHLKFRCKNLDSPHPLMTNYSRQGVELTREGDRKQGHQMMKLAHETSRRCQVLIGELLRRQGQV
jgi:hypothetical protein